jgi:hypothetical protein
VGNLFRNYYRAMITVGIAAGFNISIFNGSNDVTLICRTAHYFNLVQGLWLIFLAEKKEIDAPAVSAVCFLAENDQLA